MYPGQRASLPSGGLAAGGASVEYLLQGCSTYKGEFRARISKDVNEVLGVWGSLKAETDVHYANDGTPSTLVTLNGTVPIFYNGSQYNIPMTFWVTKDYPLTPPLVYVTPTATMQVARNHDYVAPDGTVFLPYLSQWNASRSSINGLIQTCKQVFSTFPPVHARPPNSAPSPPVAAALPPPLAQSTGAALPPPPYAMMGGSSSALNTGTPYPASSTPYPVTGPSPPPPPYPAGKAGAATGAAALPPPSGAAGAVRMTSEDEKAAAAARKERELKTARQALEIKLQERYLVFRERAKLELAKEISTQKKLEEGHRELERGLEALESQKRELETGLQTMRDKEAQFQSWLQEYESKFPAPGSDEAAAAAQLNIDEAIVPSDGPSRQLFDCVAERSAIEDLLHNLDRALSNDTVDLQTFLKKVRELARRQFMAMALSIKIVKHQQMVEMQQRQLQPPLNSRPPAYQLPR
jgi:hypothetical protein